MATATDDDKMPPVSKEEPFSLSGLKNWLKREYKFVIVSIIAVLAFLWGDVKAWLSPDAPDLVARIATNHFELPPQIVEQIPADNAESDDPNAVDLKSFVGMIDATIKNNGSFAADNVRLQIGGDGVYVAKWRTGKEERDHFKHEIKLGTIENEAEVEIQAWVTEDTALKESYRLLRDKGAAQDIAIVSQEDGMPLVMIFAWLAVGMSLAGMYFAITVSRDAAEAKKVIGTLETMIQQEKQRLAEEHRKWHEEHYKALEQQQEWMAKHGLELKRVQSDAADLLNEFTGKRGTEDQKDSQ